MKTKFQSTCWAIVVLVYIALVESVCAQSTAFTYQGRLNAGAFPATGIYDLRFAVCDALAGGNLIAGPLTNSATPVTNGLFTVLPDFGSGVFTGPARWLEIAVRTNGVGAFTTLIPRQPLTPTPYAIYAGTAGVAASAGAVAAANIVGSLAVTQLPPVLVTNGASGVSLGGTLAGNGAGLTNIPLSAVGPAGTFALLPNYFSPTRNLTVGSRPRNVVAADMNGDGKLDLIVPTGLNGTVNSVLNVLTNDGSGGFGLSTALTVGKGCYATVAADFNKDGNMDLAAANYSDQTVTVYANDGGGGFGLFATVGIPTNNVSAGPYGLATADLNGDGRPDLITANYGDNSLTVLTNNGSGFGVNATLPVGAGTRFVLAADVNGDGRADLISCNSGTNTLTVLTNNGNGGFNLCATPAVGKFPWGAAAADVNGDGKMDIISADVADSTVTVLTNNGSGGFGFNATYPVGLNPRGVIVADLNGDGRPDLLSADWTGTLTVLTNNGSGGFSYYCTFQVGLNPWGLVAADLNGDGKLDLATANNGETTVSLVLSVSQILALGSNTATVLAAHFVGDGSGLTGVSAAPAATFTGVLAGDVGGTQNATVVVAVGGQSAALVAAGASAAYTATSGNTDNAIVKRDASGNFSATTITANLAGNATTATTATNLVGNVSDSQVPANIARTNQVWLLGGNGGTSAGVNFVGTTDNQPLEFEAGGSRVLRLEPTTNGSPNVIGGSFLNSVAPGVVGAFIGGGGASNYNGGLTFSNRVEANHGSIVGGRNNLIQPNSTVSFIGGGMGNIVQSNSQSVVIVGGRNNVIQSNSYYGLISGGSANTIGSNSTCAVIAGGFGNMAAGPYAFAAGHFANALHTGAFVWADSQSGNFSSTTNDQFNVRAQGGVRFVTGGAGLTVDDQSVLFNGNNSVTLGGVFVGSFNGTATTATTATNFSGSLSGDVTGTQSATVMASVGGQSAANVASGASVANAATSADTANTIVKRDVSGNFSAGTATLNGNLNLPVTTAGGGVIYSGGSTLIHASGSQSFFAGPGAGNLTMNGVFNNTGVGYLALANSTNGSQNTASGANALHSNTSGSFNTADGTTALYSNTNGSANTASGMGALYNNTSGSANLASGADALFSNTSGNNNTAGGVDALYNNTSGSGNIALGYQAGYRITMGSDNICIGNIGAADDTNIIRIGSGQTQAFIAGVINGNGGGLSNLNTTNLTGTFPASRLSGNVNTAINFTGTLNGDVTGTQSATVVSSVGGQNAANVASGASAANAATSAATANSLVKRDATASFSATDLTLIGNLSLPATTASAGIIYSGGSPFIHAYNQNFFAGLYAGNLTLTGFGNTGIGLNVLLNDTTGNYNTGIGSGALMSNLNAAWNTAIGSGALQDNTIGFFNVSIGSGALTHNISGYNNTACGYNALLANTNGAYNMANGSRALYSNTYGSYNTAEGAQALFHNTSGSNNIALGYQAGSNLVTGNDNIDIGNLGVATDTNIIRIGSAQTSAFIAGVIIGNGGGLTNLNAASLSGNVTNSVNFLSAAGVGIGVGNPAHKLVVQADDTGSSADAQQVVIQGNSNANRQLELGYKTSGNYGSIQAVEQLVSYRPLALQPVGGNVGIAKTNPTTALDVNGVVTASSFSGSGAGLTSLNTANLSGTIGNSQLANNSINVFTSSPLSGGGLVALGGSLTLALTGVVPLAQLPTAVLTNAATGANAVALGYQTVASAQYAVVGGGARNAATGAGAVVAGGGYDGSSIITNLASGPGSVVSGGTQNIASNSRSTVGGGHNNSATNWYATVPGGAWNIAGGTGSFAAGQAARAVHDGSFVWNCDFGNTLSSSAANQFIARASGGYSFYTGTAGGATLAAGSGSWTSMSDRNAKENFTPVDVAAVLQKVAALPLSTWNYKQQTNSIRHLGPMAQDFKAAFTVGETDTGITTVDADGVALAAIQGLNQKLNEKDAEIQELKQSLTELKRMVQSLAEKK